MVAQPIGPSERQQATDRIRSAYAGRRLNEHGVEELTGRAGTQEEPGRLSAGVPARADPAAYPGVQGPVRVRDRVGDWLVRALRRVVFCWLPPPHG